jgi:predicted transcriptional regulator
MVFGRIKSASGRVILLGFYSGFICDIIILLNYKGIGKLGNQNSEFTLAVANLAAAAIAANPKLTMEVAVQNAREILRGASVTPQQIEESVQRDRIQCLEDGTWHIMLRRYIKRRFNMTPQQYRAKWGLPDDYPFVAPAYSARRSKIAKKTGLGKK